MKIRYVYILIILSAFCSCYEQIEGCLDPFSSNYGYSADTDCEDCCKYPSVTLSFKALWEDEQLDSKANYLNAHRQSLRVLSSKYLVSNLRVINQDGQVTSTSDTTTFICDSGMITSFDDFKVISNITQSYNVGDFRIGGNYSSVAFDLGTSPCVSSIDTSLIDENFSSYSELESLSDGSSYLGFSFEILRELEQDTLLINLTDTDSYREILIDGEYETTRGSNLNLNISVNYDVILGDIDLTLEKNLLEQAIIDNSKFAFSID